MLSLLTICVFARLTCAEASITADVEAWVHEIRKRVPYSLAPGITGVVVRYVQPVLLIFIHAFDTTLAFSSNNADYDTNYILALTYCRPLLPTVKARRTHSEVACNALARRQRPTGTH